MDYYMLNKPKGYITAKKDSKHMTVMEFFKNIENEKLHPVGRLDKDTEGLLIITDDGIFNQFLMRPEHHVEKRYLFYALGYLDAERISRLENGILLNGTQTLTGRAVLDSVEKSELSEVRPLIYGTSFEKAGKNPRNNQVVKGYITITEGKKHQLKRMLKSVGCYCIYLRRVSMGKLELDKRLKPGEFRRISDKELQDLTQK